MAAQPPPSLTQLSQALRLPPPSLQELTSTLGNAQAYIWFQETVRNLLPKEAAGLLAIPSNTDRIKRFETLFEKKFFPFRGGMDDMELAWDCSDGQDNWSAYQILRGGASVHLLGVSLEDFHNLWDFARPGVAATALLARYPENDQTFYSDMNEARVTWLEEALRHIPQEVLEKIPGGGIPQERLELAVQETPYAGVKQTIQWVSASSGNPFIDCSDDDFDPSATLIEWDDKEVLKDLAKSWKEGQALIDSAMELATRLEKDLPKEFEKMLTFIMDRLEQLPPPKDTEPNEETDD